MSGNSLERPHPYGCRCAGCTARTAIGLLSTGQPARAKALLEGLPDLIVEELGMAYARGHDDVVLARRSAPVARPQKPAFQRVAAELHDHVVRLGPQRVCELLNVRLCDLGPLLEGRLDVAKGTMVRLRKTEA